MDTKTGLFIILTLFAISAWGQSQLLPSIGLNTLPADSATICPIPVYTGSFDNTGFQANDPVPDFTLYKSNVDPVTLGSLLSTGKPALLVAASYTCPVFRDRILEVNQLVANYGNDVSIYLIYTVEAHPDIDISPYSGTVWTHSRNFQSGILYRQPTTYGERKDVANDLLSQISIQAEVLIDGPCNEWWSVYGPAPNNAYLIDTSGVVYEKHSWFNRPPGDMGNAIDSLLAGAPSSGNGGGSTGSTGGFTFTLDSNPVETGKAGDDLTFSGTFENVTNQGINILVKKLQNNLATDWESALCVDICLAPNVDETTFFLPPQSLQSFYFYFYTGAQPDSSTARIGFQNVDSTNNRQAINVKGITYAATSVRNKLAPEDIQIWPSPANDILNIEISQSGLYDITLLDGLGRSVYSTGKQIQNLVSSIDLSGIPGGVYWVLVKNEGDLVFVKKVAVR